MHIPVLANEVLHYLALKPGETVIDGTLGAGGHALLMLEKIAPNGRLIGIDRDERNLNIANDRLAAFQDRFTPVHDSFGNMESLHVHADAILLDLGFSSMHVDDASRGFSFQKDGPLDMRYDTHGEVTAADIVNSWSRDELAELFRVYGEEKKARELAKRITEARRRERFSTTLALADLVASVVPRHGRLHPATNVFQALRIAVNDEFVEIKKGIQGAEKILTNGGRLAIITFHSLEDRLVKNALKESSVLESITKKPVVPSREEVLQNPRSRSAKLRVAQKKGGI